MGKHATLALITSGPLVSLFMCMVIGSVVAISSLEVVLMNDMTEKHIPDELKRGSLFNVA